MYKVTSENKYHLTNRGWVFVVECPVECDRDAPSDEIGWEIEIDGTEYEIKGIERFLGPTGTLFKGEKIGVLVGEILVEEEGE